MGLNLTTMPNLCVDGSCQLNRFRLGLEILQSRIFIFLVESVNLKISLQRSHKVALTKKCKSVCCPSEDFVSLNFDSEFNLKPGEFPRAPLFI